VNLLPKVMTSLNVMLYRLTRGVLGSKMGGQSILLLFTTGRKSGRNLVISTNYYRNGENYVLVASNWGKDFHPGWYYNLLDKPAAEIQVKANKIRVLAHFAASEEYNHLWALVTSQNPYYTPYQQKTRRKIPIVILEPQR
jgi:deazaflavin-dependent oxidoreductase (nitroreductase family)